MARDRWPTKLVPVPEHERVQALLTDAHRRCALLQAQLEGVRGSRDALLRLLHESQARELALKKAL